MLTSGRLRHAGQSRASSGCGTLLASGCRSPRPRAVSIILVMPVPSDSLPLSPDTWLGRCPFCGRRLRLRAARRFGCPSCGREFDLRDARPKPEHFGLSPEDTVRFGAEPQTPEGIGWASMAAAGVLSVAICAANGGDAGACAAAGLLGGLFGGALLALGLAELTQRVARGQRQREKLYRNFLRWQSAVQAYEGFCRSVEVAEQRALEEERKEREEAKRRQVEWWRTLDGWQFEREIAALLRKRGYDVKRTGKPGDCGVDLELRCGKGKIVVQCKAHKARVGPGAVRDLYGTLMAQKGQEAWLISTSGFTKETFAFARGKRIRLLKIEDVLFGALRCDNVQQAGQSRPRRP
jgi:HJR/Mrr/RecB family endonuclease